MLEKARARGVYRDVRTGILGERLDYDDGEYDAAVVCGVFTPGHAPPSSFRELLRVVHSGGLIAFTLRHDETPPGFLEAIDGHTAAGAWARLALGDPISTMPREDEEILHRYWLFRVT